MSKFHLTADGKFSESDSFTAEDYEDPIGLIRQVSIDLGNQGVEGTCYIHTLAKVLTRFVVIVWSKIDEEYSIDINETNHDCNALFNPLESDSLLHYLSNEGLICENITIFKALLYRLFYRIIMAYDNDTGGQYYYIKYIFEYLENLKNIYSFYEIWYSPFEQTFLIEKLKKETEKIESQEELEEQLKVLNEQPFTDISEKEEVLDKLKLWERLEKLMIDEEDADIVVEQITLATKYSTQIDNVFYALVLLKNLWLNNEIVIVRFNARDLHQADNINILKEILELGFYAYAAFDNKKKREGHSMTITNFDPSENKYIFKNSWGTDNNFEGIVIDGMADAEIIENAPLTVADLKKYKYTFHLREVVFVITTQVLILVDPENKIGKRSVYLRSAEVQGYPTLPTISDFTQRRILMYGPPLKRQQKRKRVSQYSSHSAKLIKGGQTKKN